MQGTKPRVGRLTLDPFGDRKGWVGRFLLSAGEAIRRAVDLFADRLYAAAKDELGIDARSILEAGNPHAKNFPPGVKEIRIYPPDQNEAPPGERIA